MPLSPSVEREELHLRRIELRGYRRIDGLYVIEARMTDTKTRELRLEQRKTLPAGEPLHDMWMRLVVDEDLTVHDVAASTDASPFAICPEATAALAPLIGMRIGAGWTIAVKSLFAGARGCTHLTELLIPLATTAFQTLSPVRQARPVTLNARGRPAKIDTCYAYSSSRAVVQQRWPEFYDGPNDGQGGAEAANRRVAGKEST
jgi:hypothetical protein